MTAHAIQNIRNRNEWAEVINADWRKSIEGIIQTGRDLELAAAELRGEYEAMVEADLPFSKSTAKKLRKIASHPAITNGPAPDHLPPSWAVLSELTSLSAEDFADAQERGLIGANTSHRKARAISGAYKAPLGGTVGEGASVSKLPSPQEAKHVARETSRLVAASDGRLYSGATDEEGAEHVRLREQTYAVIDSINAIVEIGVSPKQWCEDVKNHWLARLEFGRIEAATCWLTKLRSELTRQKLLFDCEAKTDGE